MSKYCTSCGAELGDNAKFCGKCGKPQVPVKAPAAAAVEPVAAAPIAPAPKVAEQPKAKKSGSKTVIIIIAVILAALVVIGGIIGIIAALFIGSNTPGEEYIDYSGWSEDFQIDEAPVAPDYEPDYSFEPSPAPEIPDDANPIQPDYFPESDTPSSPSAPETPAAPETPSVSNEATEELAWLLEGIWVASGSFYDLGGDVYFEFCEFNDGELLLGIYPGSYDRPCYITDVERITHYRTYDLTLYYPAGEYMGDWYEEEYIDLTIELLDGCFYFSTSPEIYWEYYGDSLEEVREFLYGQVS